MITYAWGRDYACVVAVVLAPIVVVELFLFTHSLLLTYYLVLTIYYCRICHVIERVVGVDVIIVALVAVAAISVV